jgi:hypothetical protein
MLFVRPKGRTHSFLEVPVSPLSPEEARQALADVDAVSRQMRQTVCGDGLVSTILMLWGVVWVLVFTLSYLCFPHGDRVAWILNGAGIVATALLVARRDKQVRSEAGIKFMKQIALFWLVLMVYSALLPFLLRIQPWQTRLALMLTLIMLGYVIQGIWLKDKVIVILGLFITASILGCHAWLKPPFFLLGLGFLGGGALFAGGLAMRLRWR